MKLVLEVTSREVTEMKLVLVSLKRQGLMRSCRQLADGGYLVDVEDEVLHEFFEVDVLLDKIKNQHHTIAFARRRAWRDSVGYHACKPLRIRACQS